MDNTELLEQLFWRFLVTIVFGFGIVPAAGGAILWKTFQIAKITNFTYPQCWKAYLAACGYAYVACMISSYIESPKQASAVLLLTLFCMIPFLVVPLMLRNFSLRVLAAEAIALSIVDALIVLFVLLSSWH